MAQLPRNDDAEKMKFSLLFEKNRAQRELNYKPSTDLKTYRKKLKDSVDALSKIPEQYIPTLFEDFPTNPTKQEIKVATKALRVAARKRLTTEKKYKDLRGTKSHFPPQFGGNLNVERAKIIKRYFRRLPLSSQNVNLINDLAYKNYLAGANISYYTYVPITKEEIAYTLDEMDYDSSKNGLVGRGAGGWRCSAVQDGIKLPPILKSHFTPSNDRKMNPFVAKGHYYSADDWEKKRDYFKNSRKYCREFKTEQNKRRRMK